VIASLLKVLSHCVSQFEIVCLIITVNHTWGNRTLKVTLGRTKLFTWSLYNLRSLFESLHSITRLWCAKLTTCIRKSEVRTVCWNWTVELLEDCLAGEIVCTSRHKVLTGGKFFLLLSVLSKLNIYHSRGLQIVFISRSAWLVKPFIVFCFWMHFNYHILPHGRRSVWRWCIVQSTVVNFIKVAPIGLLKRCGFVVRSKRADCS